MLDNNEEYSLNVDNDEVNGADNKITTFVNCKITGTGGNVIGVVGVGIRMDYLKGLLKEYEDKFDVNVSLINKKGNVEISTTYTGYEKTDWFKVYGQESIRDKILARNEDSRNLEIWTSDSGNEDKSFIVSRYIPELSWNLVVMQYTEKVVHSMKMRLYQSCFIIVLVIRLCLKKLPNSFMTVFMNSILLKTVMSVSPRKSISAALAPGKCLLTRGCVLSPKIILRKSFRKMCIRDRFHAHVGDRIQRKYAHRYFIILIIEVELKMKSTHF